MNILGSERVTNALLSASLEQNLQKQHYTTPDNIYVYKKGENTEARALIKTIALVGFNAGSEREAVNAVRKEYHDNHGIMLRNDVIIPRLELFFDHNPELKQFFGKGMGTQLQYTDSQIMGNILSTLQKEHIPAIPVHDSCIIPASQQDRVHEVMVAAYQKVTNTDHIPIITL